MELFAAIMIWIAASSTSLPQLHLLHRESNFFAAIWDSSPRSGLSCGFSLDIPESLLEEARRLLGSKSQTDTVVLSLQELVRRIRIEDLKSLMGSVKLEIDIPESRRRP